MSGTKEDRYNTSDRLGIALACLGGVLGVVLYLIEKTPFTVGVSLFLIFALLVFPILHFARTRTWRGVFFGAVLAGLILLGMFTWPRGSATEAGQGKPAPSPTPMSLFKQTPLPEVRPELVSTPDKAPAVPLQTRSPKPAAMPPATSRQSGATPVVSQQGQNNIAQVGNNNQATINAVPLPRTLSQEQKDKMLGLLSPVKHNIAIGSLIGDEEAARFAISVAEVFEQAGWKVDRVIGRQMQSGYSSEAITLSLYAPQGATSTDNETAKMAVDALRATGLKVAVNPDPTMQPSMVNLYVGARRAEGTAAH